MFTSEQIIHHLRYTHCKNVEFVSSSNERLHVFKCRNGQIVYGIIGDGGIYEFNINDFKDEKWILSFNPHVK